MESKEYKRFSIGRLSTKPDKKNYIWLDNRSLTATLFLWLIYICRYLSILQWIKEIYRLIATHKKKSTKDIDAKRPNVPPIVPEIYFFVWFVLFVCFFFVSDLIKIQYFIKYIFYYYLFETFVWIIYYSLFRRFFEEKYSIYHILEYLLPLLIIFPTQAMGICSIYGGTFGEAMLAILGESQECYPNYINIIGVLYGVIVIGILISRFPEEKIKKKEGYPVCIIGSGDVVKNRLYPALILLPQYFKEDISIYDIGEDKSLEIKKYVTSEELFDGITGGIGENTILWISCASKYHIYYLKKIVDSNIKAKLIVCEKPICIDKNDLEYVHSVNVTDKRNSIFYLSYYLLEKALPLYYFCIPNSRYKKYLEIDGNLLLVKNKLGRMKKIEVVIREGKDERNIKDLGNHLYETFVHNLLLTSLFCGTPEIWNIKSRSMDENKIELEGTCGEININLLQEKNSQELMRKATLEYEYGIVKMDIDNQSLGVYLYCSEKEVKEVDISVAESYRGKKYAIQVDLVERVARGECMSEDVDGLCNQEKVINWIFENDKLFIK